MYKIVDFLETVFQYNDMRFLGSFDRSFRKSHRKFFLTPCHVTKIDFSLKKSIKSALKLSAQCSSTLKPIKLDSPCFSASFGATSSVRNGEDQKLWCFEIVIFEISDQNF